MNEAQIREQFESFDGRKVDPFRAVAAQLPASEDAAARMLKLAAEPSSNVQIGATWVLKNILERMEEPLSPRPSATLVRRLGSVKAQDALLHLLQCLPMARLGKRTRESLERALPTMLEATQHGFTRAWVFNAFAVLAQQDPALRDRVVQVLAGAYEDERPAVRARIRNALDQL